MENILTVQKMIEWLQEQPQDYKVAINFKYIDVDFRHREIRGEDIDSFTQDDENKTLIINVYE